MRFDIFLDPFQSPFGDGQQILQSLFAIGTSAPFGTGLTKGYPTYVPVVDSDFIFAGLCEEFGALFGLLLIIVIFIFFMRGLKIARESNRKHLILVAIGISVCFCFQSFLIIGGNIKFVPLTGVTLPLISYGGTSVFMSIIMIMILLRIDLENLDDESSYNSFRLIRRNVERLFYVFLAIYIGLFAYLFNFVFFTSESMVSSTYNPRVTIANNNHVRGKIYDRNMNVLAQTVVEGDNEQRLYSYGRMFAHTVGSVYSGKNVKHTLYIRLYYNNNAVLIITDFVNH